MQNLAHMLLSLNILNLLKWNWWFWQVSWHVQKRLAKNRHYLRNWWRFLAISSNKNPISLQVNDLHLLTFGMTVPLFAEQKNRISRIICIKWNRLWVSTDKEYFAVSDTSAVLGYERRTGETGNRKRTRGLQGEEEQKTDNEALRVTLSNWEKRKNKKQNQRSILSNKPK